MTIRSKEAHVAQLVEHVLGKDEVTRSIRVVGSMPSFDWAALCDRTGVDGYRPHEVFKNLFDSERKMNKRNRIIPSVFSEKE